MIRGTASVEVRPLGLSQDLIPFKLEKCSQKFQGALIFIGHDNGKLPLLTMLIDIFNQLSKMKLET